MALRGALGVPSHDSLTSLVYSPLCGVGAARGSAGVLPGPRNFSRHWGERTTGTPVSWEVRGVLCNNETLATSPGLRPRRSQMRKTFVAITAFALVPLGAAGCVSKSEYTKTVQTAEARYNALDTENARLKGELADAGKRNEQLTADRTQLERTLTMKSGELTVNMVEAILFDSGKAEVKSEGLVVLGKVIEILKTVSDKSIRIEGHTDNKPIVGPLTQRYPTNWELSAGRAINVARFLQKQGIEPTKLSAAAFGEFKSVADNATLEGRTKNRRIEIVLVPKE